MATISRLLVPVTGAAQLKCRHVCRGVRIHSSVWSVTHVDSCTDYGRIDVGKYCRKLLKWMLMYPVCEVDSKTKLSAKTVPYVGCWTVSRKLFHTTNSTNLTLQEIRKEIELISEKFTDSMDLINDAKDSLGTVYFSEDMTDAEKMVKETLAEYDTLLIKLTEEQKLDVLRTIGLKMEELKAQLDMLKEMIKD